jgi:hypothetical protein
MINSIALYDPGKSLAEQSLIVSDLCPKCGHLLGATAGLYRGKQRYFCTGEARHKIIPGVSRPKTEKPVTVRVSIEQSIVQQIDDRAGKGKRSEFIRDAIVAALAAQNTP